MLITFEVKHGDDSTSYWEQCVDMDVIPRVGDYVAFPGEGEDADDGMAVVSRCVFYPWDEDCDMRIIMDDCDSSND
jgi:hypothetical protein